MERSKIILVLGPTATGKSRLAVELAGAFNGEIINADSMQVYKHMDIGTAKPSKEELKAVHHHLIDIVTPDEDYTAARFRKDALLKIDGIRSRGRNAFIVGGTGLYIKVLTKGIFEGPEGDRSLREALEKEARELGSMALYERLKEVDPVSALSIHPNNMVRVIRALEVYSISGRPISEFQKEHGFSDSPFDALKIGLVKERAALYLDIEKRVDNMMERGLIEETKKLVSMGYSPDLKAMCGLGYKEMVGFLSGKTGLAGAVELLKKNTRHYAKRQMTWFKKDPEIRWFSPEQKKDIINLVKEHLN